MGNQYNITATNIIYPGMYIPMFNEGDAQKEMKQTSKGKAGEAMVNVCDLGHCIKVDMAIPGIRREDVLVHADDNIITVCVMHKDPIHVEKGRIRLNEFSYQCFERRITLPDGVDTAFISAEYKDGILGIYISKTESPAKNQHNDIVVY